MGRFFQVLVQLLTTPQIEAYDDDEVVAEWLLIYHQLPKYQNYCSKIETVYQYPLFKPLKQFQDGDGI